MSLWHSPVELWQVDVCGCHASVLYQNYHVVEWFADCVRLPCLCYSYSYR